MKKLVLLSMLLISAMFADIKIITDRSDIHYETLKKEFEGKTGIKLNILSVKEGLAERLDSEKFDVVYSTDSLLLESLKDKFVDIGKDNHRIYSTGKYLILSGRYRGFFTKKGLESPKSFMEIIKDDKYINKLCIRKLTHSYNIDLFTQLAMNYGIDNTKVFIKWLQDNVSEVKQSGNDRSQVKSIKEGVCDYSIGNSYYMELMKRDNEQKEWADAVNYTITEENVLLTSGVGAVNYNEEVRELFKFIESKEFQDTLALNTFEITNITKLKYNNSDLLEMRKEIFNLFK